MKDFRKFATNKMGINGMVFDDIVSMQNQYMNPYILEERQLNVTQMDVFSRLMMDRIIFLGTQIDDYTANTLQAQLLYLDSTDPGKDISIYINSPGGSVYAGLGIYDTIQFIQSPVATIWMFASSMLRSLFAPGASVRSRSPSVFLTILKGICASTFPSGNTLYLVVSIISHLLCYLPCPISNEHDVHTLSANDDFLDKSLDYASTLYWIKLLNELGKLTDG
jgi:hypothetical protein